MVLIIRWLLFEPYHIPTGSMEPTLHGDPGFLKGDRVGVNKLIYGPRVPFMNKRLFHLAEPKRWDIVVFKTPVPNALHKTLVKRVVGLPGERIHIADGKIWVNGAPAEPPESLRNVLYYTDVLGQDEKAIERFILQLAQHKGESPLLNPVNLTVKNFYAELAKIRQRLADRDPATLSQEETGRLLEELSPVSKNIGAQLFATQQAAQYPLRYGILPDDQYTLVPENGYLVCGDNSQDSADGRFFGWLPNDNIMGRAFCIMWPVPRWRDFTGFSKTWWGMGLLYGLPALLIILEGSVLIRKHLSRHAPAQ